MHPTAITEISTHDLDVALREPFGIATGAQTSARNLLVRVRLQNGVTGWGEAAPFEAVNGETREVAREAVVAVAALLAGRDARAWRTLGSWLREKIPHAASARCAVEMAALDALGRSFGMPLWVLFGGAGSTLETDLTITTGTVESARVAAATIAREGYRTIKLKVGGCPLAADIARVEAVIGAAPSCGLLLDANGAMGSVGEAIALLDAVHRAGGRVVLFEQPMGKGDLAGMAAMTAAGRAKIAADESAGSVRDVIALANARAAHVVNLKITKTGVAEVLEMAVTARALGMELMIGGMVETVMAMSMSACIAAGMGGVEFVDLDTPLWLVENPMDGGYTQRGPRMDLAPIRAGHGVVPRPGWIAG